MKNQLVKLFFIVFFSLGALSLSVEANAWWWHHHHHHHHYHCKWVNGYWSHGKWHPPYKVCWYS